MKKILSVLLVLSMLLSASATMAEGMGVQIIGGPATETEPVSLDDLKLNVDVEIPGFGIITATEYKCQDFFGVYNQGRNYTGNYLPSGSHYEYSSSEAEFVLLAMDILNVTMNSKDFLSNCSVKAIFDDVYEYGGWYFQSNYDNKSDSITGEGNDVGRQNVNFGIAQADNFAILPMYKGHYWFGVTLPNAVISSKKPLRMVITIDGNEITYNIRK